MYGFVDLNERGTSSASMSIQTIFNSINLDEVLSDDQGSFMTLTVSGRSVSEQDIQTLDVPGMNGVIEQNNATLEPKEITVKYKIKDVTNEGLRTRFSRLNSVLEGSKKALEFTDENAIFYTTMQTNNVPEEDSNELIGTLTFFCSDPYKYGPETTTDFTSDTAIIRNSGTAQADPVIELEVLAPVTFAMVQNQNKDYMMIGRPSNVTSQVVITRNLLLKEDGQTLDTWETNPTRIDGGTVSGKMNTDGVGIVSESYGTGEGWHGPALLKEVTAAQNFEVLGHIQGGTSVASMIYRVEIYLFDEGMNVLGKVAVVDNSIDMKIVKGEGRFGPFVGTNVNYPISGRNYQYNWDYFFGMLRVIRINNLFEFYVTRINTANKHVYSLKETYVDNNGEFSGKLKYIQIHLGTFGDSPRPSAKFFKVEAYEITSTEEDQTPYIAYPGDIITFDHANEEILLNGEDRKDLKDFGGSFFHLYKGENQLIMHPANSLFGNVKYRPRYR